VLPLSGQDHPLPWRESVVEVVELDRRIGAAHRIGDGLLGQRQEVGGEEHLDRPKKAEIECIIRCLSRQYCGSELKPRDLASQAISCARDGLHFGSIWNFVTSGADLKRQQGV